MSLPSQPASKAEPIHFDPENPADGAARNAPADQPADVEDGVVRMPWETVDAAKARERDRVAKASEPRAPSLDEPEDADRQPSRLRTFVTSLGKTVATLLILGLAIFAGLVIWDYYVTAPWTRDGRVRVQVASITPQVSGQITDLRVRDNQFVRKGDVLYVLDQFDFQRKLQSSQAALRMKAADFEVKKMQAERRLKLANATSSVEDQQEYAGAAAQAQAAFDAAQQDVDQSLINLKRTEVRSTVNGYVTNLLMRVGDYAAEGSSNISVIDIDSYWIDGYFEETKMARVCLGYRAEAQLLGYDQPIIGQVATVTRGISVANADPSTQGLPNVDAVYTWVRLAQRVPVRIAITHVPAGVPLVSGMTATVTIRPPETHSDRPWYRQRWDALRERIDHAMALSKPNIHCIPEVGSSQGVSEKIEGSEAPAAKPADQVTPGIAPDIDAQPAAHL